MGKNPDRDGFQSGFNFKTFLYTLKFPKNEWAWVCACIWGEGVSRRERGTVNNKHMLEIYKAQKTPKTKSGFPLLAHQLIKN